MKKTITWSLSIAAALLAGNAFAAQGQVKPKLDSDGNGVITRAEAQSAATAMFARLDANHDGKIDQADRQLRRETMKTQLFERLDANKDDQLSKAEFLAGRGAGKRGGDRQRMAAVGTDDGAMQRGHGRHGGMMRGGMLGMSKLARTGKDGAITPAQFSAAALARFDAMDTNKDGQVTQAERQAARAQMKAQRAAARTPG